MAQEEVQMFPTTSLSLGSEELETPLDDLESVVALYQPRVFRFLLATSARPRCRGDADPGDFFARLERTR